MIRHAWTVLCDKVIIDRDSNNVSLDVVEQLNVSLPEQPDGAIAIPCRLRLATLWFRDDASDVERSRARVRVLGPDGNELGRFETAIEFAPKTRRLRSFASLDVLPVSSSGVFEFVTEIYVKGTWSERARVPLQVHVEVSPGLSS